MKRTKWTFLIVALIVAVSYAEGVIGATDSGRSTKAEQTSRRSKRSRENTGGFLVRPAKGKSIRFANAQTLVSEDILAATAKEISQVLGINIVVSRLEDANTNPAVLIDDQTAGAIVVRASGNPLAATMIVAPENAWAVMDVGALAKDGADVNVLAGRVHKEMWRTVAIMLGASDSTFRPCLLEPVHSLADLDALKAKQVCPEPYGNIQRNAKNLGCGTPVFTTYRVACQEGWAPAPTNDVQKAIWNEYHELPTKPITIEFDPKKGK